MVKMPMSMDNDPKHTWFTAHIIKVLKRCCIEEWSQIAHFMFINLTTQNRIRLSWQRVAAKWENALLIVEYKYFCINVTHHKLIRRVFPLLFILLKIKVRFLWIFWKIKKIIWDIICPYIPRCICGGGFSLKNVHLNLKMTRYLI